MISYQAPDLTQHPPRSPRVRLGGYVMLPRSLDKVRARLAGKIGDYKFPNPMDKFLLTFVGIAPDAFVAAVESGKSDTEMLAWVGENAAPKRAPWEIAAWSAWLKSQTPGNAARHQHFAEIIKEIAPTRDDVHTIMERLDIDDYVSFGGRP